MKLHKSEKAYGALVDRHQERSGHRVSMTFWDADCKDCEWGIFRSHWGQPFIPNARGGFTIHHSYRYQFSRT